MTGMTGIKSTMDYLQVRGYIFFLSSIAPLSILHTILLLARPVLPEPFRTFCLPLAIQVWLIAETIAYVFLYLPFKYYFLQLSAIHPETLSREEREKLFARCWATVSDPERYLSQWFRGANREDIKRENVREWIYWAFFNTHKVTEQEDEEVEFYLSETERLLGRTLPPGKSNAKSIRLTLDAVDCSHRSLFWYFVSYFSPLLNAGLLILHAYSVSRLSILSHISRCSTTGSISIATQSHDSSHCFHFDLLRLPQQGSLQQSTSRIGIDRIYPRPSSLYYLSMV